MSVHKDNVYNLTKTHLKTGMTKSDILKSITESSAGVKDADNFSLYYSGHGGYKTGNWSAYVNYDWLKTHTNLE